MYITLVPFDVYATVNHFSSLIFNINLYDLYFSKHFNWHFLSSIADYILMIILVFFLLPFSYFYADETLSDDVSGGKDPLDAFFEDNISSDEEDGI